MADEPATSDVQTHWRRVRSQWSNMRTSIKWIVCSLVIGYLPILFAEVLRKNANILDIDTDESAGFGLGWGLWITVPCTVLAGVLVVYQLIRSISPSLRGE